jgi:hypothetical protein
MSRRVLLAIGLLWVATGALIFADPRGFHDRTPGLALMGPYSVHFIRDVGLAFLAAGTATAVGAWRRNRSVALAGTGWPLLHALFHVQIWSHRGFPLDAIAAFDLVAVITPALLATSLAWRVAQDGVAGKGIPA